MRFDVRSLYSPLFIYVAFLIPFCSSDASHTTTNYTVNRNNFMSIVNSIYNGSSTALEKKPSYYSAPVHSVVKNNFIITFEENCPYLNATFTNMMDALQHLGCSMGYKYKTTLNGCQIQFFPTEDHPVIPLELLNQYPCIKSVEEIQVMKPTQTQEAVPWGLDRIDQAQGLNEKYQFTLSGKNTHVYVIDSGIDVNHPEFRGRADLAYSVLSLQTPVLLNSTDCTGHGTHVSGIIAGNAVGVAKNANIHAVRVIGCEESTNADVVEAIDWVISNHKKPAIINMSLGTVPDPVTGQYTTVPSLDDAVERAINAGITVVVAAGNYNKNVCTGSPTNVPSLIVVGASAYSSTTQDTKAPFSNFGPCLDLFAPGTNILSSLPGGAYGRISGTSQACPHVSGVIAQILEVFPNTGPRDIERMVLNISTKNAVKGIPGTTATLLRSFVSNLPIDTFVTPIFEYSNDLSEFVGRPATSNLRLILTSIFSCIVALFFLTLIVIALRRYVLNRKSKTMTSKPPKPRKDSNVSNLEKGLRANKKQVNPHDAKPTNPMSTAFLPLSSAKVAASTQSSAQASTSVKSSAQKQSKPSSKSKFPAFNENGWTKEDRLLTMVPDNKTKSNNKEVPTSRSIAAAAPVYNRKVSVPTISNARLTRLKLVPSRKGSLPQLRSPISPRLPDLEPRGQFILANTNYALPLPLSPVISPTIPNPMFHNGKEGLPLITPKAAPILSMDFSFLDSYVSPPELFEDSNAESTRPNVHIPSPEPDSPALSPRISFFDTLTLSLPTDRPNSTRTDVSATFVSLPNADTTQALPQPIKPISTNVQPLLEIPSLEPEFSFLSNSLPDPILPSIFSSNVPESIPPATLSQAKAIAPLDTSALPTMLPSNTPLPPPTTSNANPEFFALPSISTVKKSNHRITFSLLPSLQEMSE